MRHLHSNAPGILDCTFRDGGYYTNWTFSDELVNDYLSAMAALPIDVVELGFAGKGPDAGDFANIDNKAARRMRFSRLTQLAVMIDAKDYFESNVSIEAKLDRDLGYKLRDGIDIVRIAVHFGSAHKCAGLIRILADRGYRVFLNLMQIDLADQYEIQHCIEFLRKPNELEAVYIADSLGSMRPVRVKRLLEEFTGALQAKIGFHAHDNSGLAITNSLCAYDHGARWIDCTVAGMGRGAGNVATEQLLPVLTERCSGPAQYQLQHLIIKHFSPLQKCHGWGDSLFYQIGASNGIHPTFVQEALSDTTLSGAQTLNWISRIPNNSASFSRSVLDSARQFKPAQDVSWHIEMEQSA